MLKDADPCSKANYPGQCSVHSVQISSPPLQLGHGLLWLLNKTYRDSENRCCKGDASVFIWLPNSGRND